MIRLSSPAVLLAALVLTACGGGSGLSKADLAKQADAICADVTAKLNKVPRPQSSADVADYGKKASDIIKDGANQLDDLEPGEAEKKNFDQYVSVVRKQSDLAGQLVGAAKSSDQNKIRQILTEARASDQRGEQAAKQLGFKKCGKGT